MKVLKIYRFEDGDSPSPKEITESFNLLYEFCPELRSDENPIAKAFHAVTCNREFSREQWQKLNDYGLEVARSAEERYTLPAWKSAPWREAIMQNAARLRGCLVGLENLLFQAER